MNSSEWYKINNVVKIAASAIEDNEKFLVGPLAVRARKLAEANPADQTVVGLSGYLRKRADSGAVFITRADLKSVYNQLYTLNNGFVKNFQKELGITDEVEKTKVRHDPNEGSDLIAQACDKMGDQVLVQGLKAAFDDTIPYRPYSDEMGRSAQRTCAHELNCMGVLPKKIEVVAGRENVIICQAMYETPKGSCYVLVPVEVKNGKTLMPSMFLAKEGFVNISADAIHSHIEKTAGKSFQVNVEKLLNNILVAQAGYPSEMTDIERIIMKAAAAKEVPANQDPNAILYQEVDIKNANVELPEYEQPEEVQRFAEKLASGGGIAEFCFGKEAVKRGAGLIKMAIQEAGYNNSQIAVNSSNDDTIFYAVCVDGQKGFSVPVKVSKKQVLPPKVAIADGGIYSLDAAGISQIIAGTSDQRAVAMASQLHEVKPSELIEEIRMAMEAKNYKRAEDALNVVKQSGNEQAYHLAYSTYVDGLRGKVASVPESKCSAPTKSPSSKYVICSHTGLPVHEVYQDKNGDCLPLYRKGMQETGEGALFLANQICFE